MYSEPILREKLVEMKDKNHQLLGAVEQIAEKYEQYAELLMPLLEAAKVTDNLLA